MMDLIACTFKKLWFQDDCNRLQVSPLMVGEFKQINEHLFPLKSTENRMFRNDFKGNVHKLSFTKSLQVKTAHFNIDYF